MRKVIYIPLVLFLSYALAIAAEFSFQGIVLGQSFQAQFPGAKIITKDDETKEGAVEIPPHKRIGFDNYVVAILDGDAHCVYGTSTPKLAAEYTLPALTRWYGQPDVKTYPVHNMMGAKFDAVKYAWKLPNDIRIALDVSTKSIDKAQLAVTTKKCRDVVAKR
jgi:hypothetical protein